MPPADAKQCLRTPEKLPRMSNCVPFLRNRGPLDDAAPQRLAPLERATNA